MKNLLLSFCTLLLLYLFSCQPVEQSPASITTPEKGPFTLLHFIKENKSELWTQDVPPVFQKSIQTEISYPNDAWGVLRPPNEWPFVEKDAAFLKEKSIEECIIFPNDPRNGAGLNPCFACRHDKAYVYSKLELLIDKYTK